MKHSKFLIVVFALSFSFASCATKDYTCTCNIPDDTFCPTPWVVAEIKGKTKRQAKAKCNTYNVQREVGSVVCDIK